MGEGLKHRIQVASVAQIVQAATHALWTPGGGLVSFAPPHRLSTGVIRSQPGGPLKPGHTCGRGCEYLDENCVLVVMGGMQA